jgi:hypothetical protein
MQGRRNSGGGRGRGRGSPTSLNSVAEKSGGGGSDPSRVKNGGPMFPMEMAGWSDTGLEPTPSESERRSKRQTSNTGGDGTESEVSLLQFDTMTVDDKLSTMMRKLINLDNITDSLADIREQMDSSMEYGGDTEYTGESRVC